jgi:hypothetical protein
MPKLSVEGTIGLLFEVLVVLLEHLHFREPFIIWSLFVVGFLLIFDVAARGHWASKYPDAKVRKRRRFFAAGLAVLLCGVFGLFIYKRIGRTQQTEAKQQNLELPPVSTPLGKTGSLPSLPPVVVPPAVKVVRKATPKVSGHHNVAGSNVAGNGNVVGNDNQVTTPAPTAIAPNGIAITGGNVQSPTVNNYGFAPPKLTFTEESVPDRSVPTLKVRVKTDRPVAAAIVGVEFSGEVEVAGTHNSSDPDYPELLNSGASNLNWMWPLVGSDGVRVPNTIGFFINMTYFLPGMELVFVVTSKEPVHVITVVPVQTGASPKPR